MNAQKTLVFFGAHPDDETFGMGGTLAQYAMAGVRVYYVIATRGEAGDADPEFMKNYSSVGDLRWAELTCAAKLLGLAGVLHLGYRDSGMPGAKDNHNPNALMNAPQDQVAGRMVKSIRDLRPQVVVTFDPIGGYGHPDHIAVHNAAVKAFYAAGDQTQYPDAGTAFRPGKLYFGTFPRRGFRAAIKLMPLFGQNPHRFGRNKDIDLTKFVDTDFPLHAAVRLSKKARQLRDQAIACHASQLSGGPFGGGVLGIVFSLSAFFDRIVGERDYFIREYPVPTGNKREKDLFEGV